VVAGQCRAQVLALSEASAVFHQSETNYSTNDLFKTINQTLEIYMLVAGGCKDLARNVRIIIFIHI
jgi:hypothetical protein